MNEIIIKNFRGKINVIEDKRLGELEEKRNIIFELEINIKDAISIEELIALHEIIKDIKEENWRGWLYELKRRDGENYKIEEYSCAKGLLNLSRKRILTYLIGVSLIKK